MFGVRITGKGMQPMSDQQEVQRQTALRLRDIASRFLDSATGIDDPDLRRKLTRAAFELAQEAVALERIKDQPEFGSLGPFGASNPDAHVRNPKMTLQADLTAQWIIAQEQIAQAEARLADLWARRESVQGELYKLLGEDGFRAFHDGWLRGEEIEQPSVRSHGKTTQTTPR
jgi:hypothetical protein